MLSEMKKTKLLAIVTSCVLLTGAIFPSNLFAETVTEEWVATYDGPGNYMDHAKAVTMDDLGNVYVTGGSNGIDTGLDYATIKYDANGNQLWVARYNGSENDTDVAHAIAVDAAGNVYVTGWSVVSGFEPAYSIDYATIKYDADGNEVWVVRYNGPANGKDGAEHIALDGLGNVYVAGFSKTTSTVDGTGLDYATIKYDANNGALLWVKRYNGPADSSDEPHGMAVDALGNVYVTGWSDSGSLGKDYATVKYDTDGTQIWASRYNGPGNDDDYVRAIAVDSSGNVYITGDSIGIETEQDYATINYDMNGNEVWVARYNGLADLDDRAYDVAVDGTGDVYVTGQSRGGGAATIKYDSSGNEIWVAKSNSLSTAQAMALDTSGNVYITGNSTDYVTEKYDTAGNELWSISYDGTGNSSDYAFDIVVGGWGDVCITGDSVGIGTERDYATVKYSPDPAKAIEELIAMVISLNLKNGTTNSLDGKLGAALNALDDINTNNNIAAINTLEAFIAKVELERGKNEISETDADVLIQMAVNILNMLSGP